MKKRLMLVLSLVVTVCLLSGCAYLPLAGLTSRIPMGDLPSGTQMPIAGLTNSTAAADHGETVTISKAEYERYRQFDQLLTMIDIVNANFYEEVDAEKLLTGAAEGLLSSVGDPYTFYYTPDEYARMWEDDEGEYAGIGIQIQGDYGTGICTVTRVFANSPAKEAGVQKGDILYRVNHELYVTATSLDEAVSIMRGTPGTPVDVTFLRNGEELTFTINRAVVNTNRVEAGMLTDEVGYIILYEFAGDCYARFQEAVTDLTSKGAKGLILDLRDNPGGWVEDAKNIADIFLDAGVVATAKFKDGSEEVYRTRDGKVELPLVMMVNEHSASSSEILTGCLKERADATVVGKQSYGKGIIQAVLPLTNGAGMQLTIAQYFTPNGNAVHKIGITPDVEVDLAEGDNGMHEFGDLEDAQLKKALEIMQEKLAR